MIKSNAKGVIIFYVIIIIIFLQFISTGCFRVVIYSTCSDSLSNLSLFSLNLITPRFFSFISSGYHVICFTEFPLSLLSIGLITAWFNCREKEKKQKTNLHTHFFKCHFVKVAALVSFCKYERTVK